MGSSFEDLVVTSPTVKTDFQSDKQFGLQKLFKYLDFALNLDDVNNFGGTCMHAICF
jgi:hypothetical protein